MTPIKLRSTGAFLYVRNFLHSCIYLFFFPPIFQDGVTAILCRDGRKCHRSESVSTKCRPQTADWRLQTGYKMQTRYKMQTADCRQGTNCRLSLKCRLTRKTAFCVTNEITFDFVSYLLSRNNLTMSSSTNNTRTLSLFFKNVILLHGSVLIYF